MPVATKEHLKSRSEERNVDNGFQTQAGEDGGGSKHQAELVNVYRLYVLDCLCSPGSDSATTTDGRIQKFLAGNEPGDQGALRDPSLSEGSGGFSIGTFLE